jgi:hypothetical protein
MPPSPFLERLLTFLIPYFTETTTDLAAARAEALATLVSYGARTRAELLHAAQIIVFSFVSLETLAETVRPDLSLSMRLRLCGSANNLNRSSQKTEQALAKRLARDIPAATDPQADPINDLPDTEAEDLLRHTQATIDTHRNRANGAPSAEPQVPASGKNPAHIKASADHSAPGHSAPGKSPVAVMNDQPAPALPKPPAPREPSHSILVTQHEGNRRAWGAAMMESLAQMGMPVKSPSRI